jgi:Tol biopolymer transport system component
MHPGWSPDSKQIAFTFIGSSDSKRRPDSAIGIINRDGSGFSQITPNDKSRYPHWSPDGKQILFNREGNIYLMSITGTDVKALTQDGKSHQPTWSPDGNRIAYISTENQRCGPTIVDSMPFCTSELRVMNADGSNVIQLRSMRNTEISWPVWGPMN